MDAALAVGPDVKVAKPYQLAFPPAKGMQTVLHLQELAGEYYLDSACVVSSDIGSVETASLQ